MWEGSLRGNVSGGLLEFSAVALSPGFVVLRVCCVSGGWSYQVVSVRTATIVYMASLCRPLFFPSK